MMSLQGNPPAVDQIDKYQQALTDLASHFKTLHLAQLFAQDAQRFQHLKLEQQGILFDYSKQRISAEVIAQLTGLAGASGLQYWIEQLFSDARINHTEQRAAMHWALRTPADADNLNVAPEILQQIHLQIERMGQLVEQLHAGQFRGCTGEQITDVVNIGVGGSDLGPLMVSHALSDYRVSTPQQLQVHFASSMDGSQLSVLLKNLRPETTLFIISSKSFTTIDTLYNAETARAWLQQKLGHREVVTRCHFIGVSTSQEKMSAWGIVPEHQLGMWDWVGGRFSLWSAIGLPIALNIGIAGFKSLLAGAYMMDQHFRQAAWHENLPVLMGLIGIWNNNFLKIQTQAVLPYDGRLKYLSAYLQQLEMESNGKSVDRNGDPVKQDTCPIIWGDVGPNAQHAFYQLLHQGTQAITCDFIAPALRYHLEGQLSGQTQSSSELQAQHQLALANCLAQSRLLALGEHALDAQGEPLPEYKRYHGNQPNSTILLKELNPYNLGALLAAYEHKVFVQSVIWQVNPFDQWGVEMGKEIAKQLLPALQQTQSAALQPEFDASTQGLLDYIQAS